MMQRDSKPGSGAIVTYPGAVFVDTVFWVFASFGGSVVLCMLAILEWGLLFDRSGGEPFEITVYRLILFAPYYVVFSGVMAALLGRGRHARVWATVWIVNLMLIIFAGVMFATF